MRWFRWWFCVPIHWIVDFCCCCFSNASVEKSVGLCAISFPSSAGKCFDMAFSKSRTEVASVAPSGIVRLVFERSLSAGDMVATGLGLDFLRSSSLSSSSQSACFRFFCLLAGIGEVRSGVVWGGNGCVSLSLVRCVTSEVGTGADDEESVLFGGSVLSTG